MSEKMFRVVVFFIAIAAVSALQADYQSKSAVEKQTILWGNISSRPHAAPLPTANPGPTELVSLFNPTWLVKIFTNDKDEFEVNRTKLSHTYGAVAKTRIDIVNGSRYTGIFRTGCRGLTRLSVARYDNDKFAPNMAIKCLVDGRPSLNIFAMYDLEGQGSNTNFFQNNMSNVIAPPTSLPLKMLGKAFALAIRLIPGGAAEKPENEENLPLQWQATVNSNGATVGRPVAPFAIIFKPNQTLGWNPATANDFRTHLANVTSGSKIYDIFARQNATTTTVEFIGTMTTESPFVASAYGDRQLAFQHHGRRWRA